MTAIHGSAAAVTGAASGIGRALALELAARGCDLALADRDEAGLQAVAAEIASAHSRKVHIVNLSSIFGIIAPPGQTAYCAAKFAVRGFSESLRHELQMAASPVQLSVVHPGGVATN